ncbi:MAG TPA: hypothetical protein EYN96_00480 [Candidatus Hydrogenedentes bacterium]|nr:hypothetical protein [Candidatus Hydrogenedentota bacterium]
MKHYSWLIMLLMVGIVAGCGGSSEEAPAEPQAPEPVEETDEVIAAPATPDESEETASEEEEEAKVTLPEVLSDLVALPEGLILAEIEVKDEAKQMYHIVADTRDNPDKFQKKLIKIYADKGWVEDMNMAQKGSSLTGFNNGEFMVYVEANKGNIGSIVTIDTGLL